MYSIDTPRILVIGTARDLVTRKKKLSIICQGYRIVPKYMQA